MRTEISSREIAKRFGKSHRHVMRAISAIHKGDDLYSATFTESVFTSAQNKVLNCYTMGINGFCLATDTWGYSRGKQALIKAEILNEFGESFVVVGSIRSRSEDLFYDMLKSFLSQHTVIRQFGINGCKVDFYIKEMGLIVEFDESYHFSKAQIKKDRERIKSIEDFIRYEFDDAIAHIRVKAGEEMNGLAAIAGYIALNSHDSIEMTNYYDKYDGEASSGSFPERCQSAALLEWVASGS